MDLRHAVLIVALMNLGYFGGEFIVALTIGSVSFLADSPDFLSLDCLAEDRRARSTRAAGAVADRPRRSGGQSQLRLPARKLPACQSAIRSE